MFEKVNPSHPDKIADRIAGAIVDLAYRQENDPKIAVEVMIGHGVCYIISETSVPIRYSDVIKAVERIAGKNILCHYKELPQDVILASNQKEEVRCGDNGIFKGVPLTDEEKTLTIIAEKLYEKFPYDGKYILDKGKLTICQSNAKNEDIINFVEKNFKEMYDELIVNPLGEWTGGIDVDTGITGRKLGSDMAQSITGGSINGKDLSKADVSVNINAWSEAQIFDKTVEWSCSIGDVEVADRPYKAMVVTAKNIIDYFGGFEKFSEWGLVRSSFFDGIIKK